MAKAQFITGLITNGYKIEVINLRETKDFYINDNDGGQKYRKHETCNVRKHQTYDSVAISTSRYSHDAIYLLDSEFASSDFVIETVGLELLTKKFNTSHPNIEYIKNRYAELDFIKHTKIALDDLNKRINGDYEACLSLNDRLKLGVKHIQKNKDLNND